ELGLRLDGYLSIAQGQVTFAVTRNGWNAKPEDSAGLLLLVDTGTKAAQLKTNLTQLRQHWVSAGKPMRTERVRDCQLMILSLASNDLPKSLRPFLPQRSEIQELGPDGEVNVTKAPQPDLIIGQSGPLLLIGSTLEPLEQVLARAGGSDLP